jgi:hypothetical protein
MQIAQGRDGAEKDRKQQPFSDVDSLTEFEIQEGPDDGEDGADGAQGPYQILLHLKTSFWMNNSGVAEWTAQI